MRILVPKEFINHGKQISPFNNAVSPISWGETWLFFGGSHAWELPCQTFAAGIFRDLGPGGSWNENAEDELKKRIHLAQTVV